MTMIILSLIYFYQKTISRLIRFINPSWGCRFYPTCSEYCRQAIKKYGLPKGLFKGLKRIIRCNPFNEGGYDPC